MESLTILALVRMVLKVWPFEITFISRFYKVNFFFQIHAYLSTCAEDLHAKPFRKLSKCPKIHLGLQHFYLELAKIFLNYPQYISSYPRETEDGLFV